MFENILERPNLISLDLIRVKYSHLAQQNVNHVKTIQQLEQNIKHLRCINQQLKKNCHQNIRILINELSQQNMHLQNAIYRIRKINQQLFCEILMKNQLLCQNNTQYKDILATYEEKIYQLRLSLQSKQVIVTHIEQKYMQDKEDNFSAVSRVNFMYFNEVTELKILLDKLSIQNSQLKLMNKMQQQQIGQRQEYISRFQKALKNNKQIMQKFKNQLTNDKTRQKTHPAKKKLQEQQTRFDVKYKNIIQMNSNSSNQIVPLKFLVLKLSNQLSNEKNVRKRLEGQLLNKRAELNLLKRANKRYQQQITLLNSQIKLLKSNAQQKSNLTVELKQKSISKQQTIAYWKNWGICRRQQFDQRVNSFLNSIRQHKIRKSKSCINKLHYKQIVSGLNSLKIGIDNAEFTIDHELTYNVNQSVLNFTINQKIVDQNKKDFDDDISIIIKPKHDHKRRVANKQQL